MHFVIFHPYDTPTFKTKALHLATIEGWLKRLLLLRIYTANTALSYPCLAVTGDVFRHFPPVRHTHF